MRYSTNLNIIIKAIEKATARTSRDFSELEILQSNPNSAIKFSNACYKQIKDILIEDLSKIRPDFNIIFADGQKIIQSGNAEYSFVIYPIDGMNNLVRGISDFTVAIALEHNKDGVKEAISVAINNVIKGELYYCEKGFGAFLNNRRIRVSKRGVNDPLLISSDDYSYLNKEVLETLKLTNFAGRTYGCKTLEMAYLASSRFDLSLFKNINYEYLKPFTLLVREAGGKIIENDKFVVASNGLIGIHKNKKEVICNLLMK